MAYKVFTNGSVLQASEINDNLMRQSVMVFSNAAARTAAITSPVEGMLTWLEDVNRYESYNGSAWSSPFGLTFLSGTTFTGVTSVSINNIFTSQYDDYLILANIDSLASGSGLVTYRLRASGSDNSTANYNFGLTERNFSSTSFTAINGVSQTSGRLGFYGAGELFNASLEISNPVQTQQTMIRTNSIRINSSTVAVNEFGHGTFAGTNSFDGVTILAPGNITGKIAAFGYRKN